MFENFQLNMGTMYRKTRIVWIVYLMYSFGSKQKVKNPKFSSISKPSRIVRTGSGFVCELHLPHFLTRERFEQFGVFSEILSFSFLGHNFQKKQNSKTSFKKITN